MTLLKHKGNKNVHSPRLANPAHGRIEPAKSLKINKKWIHGVCRVRISVDR